MSGPLSSIAQGFLAAIRPLRSAIEDPGGMNLLLSGMGWSVDVSTDALSTLPWADELLALLDDGEALVARIENGSDDLAVTLDLLRVAQDVIDLIDAIQSSPPLDEQLPALFHDATFWAAFSAELPDRLLLDFLEREHAMLHGVLVMLGIVEETFVPATDVRGWYVRRRLDWSRIGPSLGDAMGQIATRFGWGTAQDGGFQQEDLMFALARVWRGLEFRPRLRPVSTVFIGHGKPFPDADAAAGVKELAIPLLGGAVDDRGAIEVGLVIVPIPEPGTASPIRGLLLSNLVWGTLGTTESLGPSWVLALDGDFSATGTTGMAITPEGAAEYTGAASADASLTFTGAPPVPWRLLGGDSGPRLELGGLVASAEFRTVDGEPELVLSARTGAPGTTPLVLRVDLADGDSFLAGIFGGIAIQMPFDLDLRWSSRSGLTVGGSAGLALTLPLDAKLGPVTVQRLALGAGVGDGTPTAPLADLLGSLDASVTIGPMALAVQRFGLRGRLFTGDLRDAVARFGGLGLDVGFLPPTGVGISVDAEGIVNGGGFLSIDTDAGRYAGVAELDMLGVGLTAIGIVETRLPGGSAGWSLFLSIMADFTPLQLGFGFTLNGVGGFMGLHRTMDEIALADGVREGRLDSLLFPSDPVADATRILSDIEAYFPTLPDHHAFGAMAKIGWGSPTLITAELGVILTVPDVRLAVVGEVASVLPTADRALLSLHMGVLGYIDVAEAVFWIAASIYDSQLVGLSLSGDMAMYVSLGDDPYFLLSVGGYHPGWKPPKSVPSSMRGLSRMAAAIDLGDPLRITLESYFAITSNTLQFGADLVAVAAARLVGVDFSARGAFSFDVLMMFSPFSLVADMSAGVSIKADGNTLFSVQLDLHVEGPDPWFGSGHAEFKFLGCDVDFRVQVGGHASAEAVVTTNVWTLLEAALQDIASWVAPTPPAEQAPGVSFRTIDPAVEPGLWLAPDSTIEIRQRVVPLNREIETFGALVPEGDTRFDVEAVGLLTDVNAASTAVQDWYAPSQFTPMSRTEQLAAPSFELMDAGVRFTASGRGIAVTSATADVARVEIAYEVSVIDDLAATEPPLIEPLPASRLGLGLRRPATTRRGATTRRRVESDAFVIAPVRYTVVEPLTVSRTDSGKSNTFPEVASSDVAFADAVGARRAFDDAVPSSDGRRRIVPTHAVRVGIIDLPDFPDVPGTDGPGIPGTRGLARDRRVPVHTPVSGLVPVRQSQSDHQRRSA